MNFEYNVWAAVWRNFYFVYFEFFAETYPERHGLKTRTIETPQRAYIFKAYYCLKVHNANFSYHRQFWDKWKWGVKYT